MSRWDYDTVFYRVFCITLLAVAVTFTVILTNVFVDIDGILSNKHTGETLNPVPETKTAGFIKPRFKESKSEEVYEDKDYQDSNDLYRSKRSLGPQNLLLQIKDPTVKKILTNRLTTLLDELDEEESNNSKNDKIVSNESRHNKKTVETDKKDKNTDKVENTENSNEFIKLHQILSPKNINSKHDKVNEEPSLKSDTDENDLKKFTNKVENKDELLHLAMHNIILQGIIGNMKMENVYKKVHDLVMNFEKHKIENQSEGKVKEAKHTRKAHSEELKLIDELVNCKDLQKQIVTENSNRNILRMEDFKNNGKHNRDPNVIIKTIIDITGPNDKTNSESVLNSKANLNGVVKLVYNGKSIRFRRIDDSTIPATSDIFSAKSTEAPESKNIEVIPRENTEDTDVSYKTIIQNYLKKLSKDSTEHDKVYSRKRLKRHIKIRYEKTTQTPNKKEKEDDELFVEIETHFDSHGTNGEKKKKLIRDLINKIKKAIHSNSEVKKKKYKHLHVKKRTQNRLDNHSPAFVNNVLIPIQNINHRQIDPISKSVTIHEKVPLISDEAGSIRFKKYYNGPGFLVKKINSAELATVDTEYNKVSDNGIPQRLQIPLNNDLSDETQSGTNTLDLGNIKFLVKDIEGSGFSVGFNQFQGESPDPESMKLFTGLENVIQTYHQKYDQEVTENPTFEAENIDKSNNYERYSENIDRNIEGIDRYGDNVDVNNDNFKTNTDNTDEYETRNNQEHLISRRSIAKSNESHKHLNEYRDIMQKNFLPYDNYEDIYNKGDESYIKRMQDYIKPKSLKDSVLVIDEKIFEKDLKPAEIFTIADLFARKKRSVKVKQISNLKSKKKLNRYINTKSMAAKSIFQNKKRTKRQIDKIRIVARDSMGPNQNSEEDIFVVSDEKIFADRAVYADRAVLTQLNLPQEDHDKVPVINHYDIIAPQNIEENHYNEQPKQDDRFEIISPYVFDAPHNQNAYTRTSRLSSLMAKYPHIIMEEASKEEAIIPYRRQAVLDSAETTTNINPKTIPYLPTTLDLSSNNNPELADLMPQEKANYKVTVKIRPKNSSLSSGFKEVHTSINKSYNKNGLLYTSLVNVSEVSKVEKLNKNSTRRVDRSNLKSQQDFLKSLINQHKSRIEEQLKHLNSEKEKLDALNVENVESLPEELIDMALETSTKKSVINKVISTTKSVKIVKVANSTISVTTSTTTIKPTTTKTITTTQDPDKLKLMSKIERNENLTSEILKKIDKNTGILETFLEKILNKMYVPVTEVATTEKTETNTPLSKIVESPFLNYQIMSQNKMDQIDVTKNQSYGIPFVYSYQQTLNPDPKVLSNNVPLNNVIYSRQIHTNTIARTNNTNNYFNEEKINKNVIDDNETEKVSFFKPQPGEMVINNYVLKNNTRFYLDALGDDFRNKMIPLASKTHMYNTPYNIPENATII